ncbi:MAG: GWxTD domain-containing protein [Ignavibacteriaceae bacterium]|nr:GWxTD domain-containing protein [Ignavibacteriaceae bacterium]
MNKVKIKALFLCIIFTALAYSQNHSNSSGHNEFPGFKFLYAEINSFPLANNNWEYYYTFRIPYDHLVFVKDDNYYIAGFSLAVEVTDSLGNSIDRQIQDGNIRVSDYKETDSDILFYQGMLTFNLPEGNYNFLPIITDMNSRDEVKLKKIINSTLIEKYKFLLPPIIVNSKKVQCGNQEMSVLTNYDGFIPFSNNSYDIIIPSKDTSFTNLKAIIMDDMDTVFNGPLTQSSVFNLSYQVCDSQIVIGSSGKIVPTRNFILKDLCNKLYEGGLKFLFFKDGESKPFVSQNGICFWIDKPSSLMDPEFAIKMLKYMTTDDEISKILDVKEKNYTRELFKFWKKYDPTPATQYNEVMTEYYKRVDYAAVNYSALSKKQGYDTDRGKIYILFGKPKKIERYSNSDGKIVETWYYDQQKKFIFVDKQGTGEFSLQKG